MIVITGAAGFIGSCVAGYLNSKSRHDLLLVDDFSNDLKSVNWQGKRFLNKMSRDLFPDWFIKNPGQVDFVFHLGARTDTAETDRRIFDRLNLNYSKAVWKVCARHQIPLVYASSAATYGMGEQGFEDRHNIIPSLAPLNAYGISKNEFDKWVLEQDDKPPFWAGLKFFNVYGPNEYHKGRMASVVFHCFQQIQTTGKMKLFRSHHPDFKDGGQQRDFVYVKDVLKVCYYLFKQKPKSGIYNLGTGRARTFMDLAAATFNALDKVPQIEFIDTPVDIRDTYQYYTEAKMEKLCATGFHEPFLSLEDGIDDYVKQYLVSNGNY